ncbi:hypothetical protein L1049_011593 [Liquidambar formosana]|uniref:Ribosomal protein L9 n=1 Tax=Liquidambar formosana TaxID=63359 RepID=A0AAP0RWX3_LIQFO
MEKIVNNGKKIKPGHGYIKVNEEFDIIFRRTTTAVRTALSHIENLITNVTKGHCYKNCFIYAHFPINVFVTNANKAIKICNFLGKGKASNRRTTA